MSLCVHAWAGPALAAAVADADAVGASLGAVPEDAATVAAGVTAGVAAGVDVDAEQPPIIAAAVSIAAMVRVDRTSSLLLARRGSPNEARRSRRVRPIRCPRAR